MIRLKRYEYICGTKDQALNGSKILCFILILAEVR